MAIGSRGSNPIWLLDDLTGHLFDDTFYMFVLENQIPYAPATIYRDASLNIAWTNPIQFLANGTLPVDVYFENNVFYRLEFRQNDGITTPSQSDPLIYEVNNYTAINSGSTPIESGIYASENQVTNPQFALTSFTSPFTLTGSTNPPSINIGEGWFLDLTGTGNATITQVALTSTTQNPSNAPYALRLEVSGWDSGGVVLKQRFQQNGMLWANKTVSSTLTARIDGSPQSVTARLIDSNNTVLAQVLDVSAINSTFNQYTGHGTLPESSNPNTPPSAYIEYKLFLPNNVDIYLSSIQLIVQDKLDLSEPDFIEDSINRQIDNTYHSAYPIIPVGAVIDFAGTVAPLHYLQCDGALVSKITYAKLFAILGTIWGAGNATQFNLPDLSGLVTAGSGGTLPPLANTVGSVGGVATHAISILEMPLHNHTGSSGTVPVGSGGGGAIPTAANLTTIGTNAVTLTIAPQGGGILNTSGEPMTLVQPTAIMLKCIRFE